MGSHRGDGGRRRLRSPGHPSRQPGRPRHPGRPRRPRRPRPSGSSRRARRPSGRRRLLVPAIAAALGLVLAAGLVAAVAGLPTSDRDHPAAAGETGNGAAGGKARAATIVPGVHLVRHVPTAAELDAKFARRGLERVGQGATRETGFNVSSFNVFGASYTGTKNSAHPRWPSGAARIARAVGVLRDHDVSVVGMQELQVSQLRAFEGAAREYDVYPGTSVAGTPSDNSIAWRTADWELVDARLTPIPYYGAPVKMPHVLLRNRDTGREVWFANYHNASDVHGSAQGKRDAAVRTEAALVKELSADGTPVIETGDYNDRQEAACPMMSLGDMHASNGSTYSASGCSVPMRPYPTVDWVFGTENVSFSDHVADWSTHDRQISDHEMIRTHVTIAPRADDDACLARTVGGKKLHWCPKG